MSKNILVIDDSYYMRTILKNILEDAGYNVVNEAASGQEALQFVDQSHADLDLITLDLILPDNSGLDVLRTIKERYPDQDIVVVSAVGQNSIIDQAMEIGANAYIIKPFEEKKVVEIVRNILDKSEVR